MAFESEDLQQDELRAIPGTPGYRVTAYGRVWSEERSIRTTNGRSWTHKGRWLRQIRNGGGYLVVNIHRDGKVLQTMVHRLVAMAFLPNPLKGQRFINHKDSCRHNNHVSNLEWCTAGENLKHAWQEGLRVVTPGARAALAKGHAARRRFSYEQAAVIRDRVTQGEKQIDIAHELGINPSTICQIVKRDIYVAYQPIPTTGESNGL